MLNEVQLVKNLKNQPKFIGMFQIWSLRGDTEWIDTP